MSSRHTAEVDYADPDTLHVGSVSPGGVKGSTARVTYTQVRADSPRSSLNGTNANFNPYSSVSPVEITTDDEDPDGAAAGSRRSDLDDFATATAVRSYIDRHPSLELRHGEFDQANGSTPPSEQQPPLPELPPRAYPIQITTLEPKRTVRSDGSNGLHYSVVSRDAAADSQAPVAHDSIYEEVEPPRASRGTVYTDIGLPGILTSQTDSLIGLNGSFDGSIPPPPAPQAPPPRLAAPRPTCEAVLRYAVVTTNYPSTVGMFAGPGLGPATEPEPEADRSRSHAAEPVVHALRPSRSNPNIRYGFWLKDRRYSTAVAPNVMITKSSSAGEELAGPLGVFVTMVAPRSPARRAGIRPGDRVLAVDGIEVETLTMAEVLGNIKNSLYDVSITISRPPAIVTTIELARPAPGALFGFAFGSTAEGLFYITTLNPSGLATAAGFACGDKLVSVDGIPCYRLNHDELGNLFASFPGPFTVELEKLPGVDHRDFQFQTSACESVAKVAGETAVIYHSGRPAEDWSDTADVNGSYQPKTSMVYKTSRAPAPPQANGLNCWWSYRVAPKPLVARVYSTPAPRRRPLIRMAQFGAAMPVPPVRNIYYG